MQAKDFLGAAVTLAIIGAILLQAIELAWPASAGVGPNPALRAAVPAWPRPSGRRVA